MIDKNKSAVSSALRGANFQKNFLSTFFLPLLPNSCDVTPSLFFSFQMQAPSLIITLDGMPSFTDETQRLNVEPC